MSKELLKRALILSPAATAEEDPWKEGTKSDAEKIYRLIGPRNQSYSLQMVDHVRTAGYHVTTQTREQ